MQVMISMMMILTQLHRTMEITSLIKILFDNSEIFIIIIIIKIDMEQGVQEK